MNIVQAYTKFRGQTIILFSGFSGSGKTKIAKFIADLFNFEYLSLSSFYVDSKIYDKEENYTLLKNDVKVLDWDNVYRSINWDKFNEAINKIKGKGVVVVGFGFPSRVLEFEPDFHIHIKIPKKNLIENREKYMEKHATDFYLGKEAGSETAEQQAIFERDKMILNLVTYPTYLKVLEDSKIDKFINVSDLSQTKKDTFEYLMSAINKWLESHSNIDLDHKSKSHDKLKPKVHYETEQSVYDWYYPDKKRLLYDFNDEGIDYPPDVKKRYDTMKYELATSTSSTSESNSSNSDAVFMFTSKQ